MCLGVGRFVSFGMEEGWGVAKRLHVSGLECVCVCVSTQSICKCQWIYASDDFQSKVTANSQSCVDDSW